MSHRTRFVAALALAVVSSCAAEPASVDQIEQPIEIGCDAFSCGGNAAQLYTTRFHELDLSGRIGDHDITYVGFSIPIGGGPFGQRGWRPLRLTVERYHLVGIDDDTPGRDGQRFVGEALRGAVIELKVRARTAYVRIAAVDTTRLWADPGRDVVPAYTFEYSTSRDFPDDDRHLLCTGTAPSDDPWRIPTSPSSAVVFAGDHYDEATMTVSVGPEYRDRVNIGCAGSAVAKMLLLRHAEASSDLRHTTALAQRQTMLKALVADYCGDGTSFTVNGEKVHYMDARGWHPFDLHGAGTGTFEAVWNENGAVCLDEPRRQWEESHSSPPRDVRAEVAARCALPACPPNHDDWASLGYVVTANPTH